MTDDDEDILLLGDISDCPADVPSQSPRTSNLPWVNKIILGSKPSTDPSKSPPNNPDNISNNNDSPPEEPDVSKVCKHCNVKFDDIDSLAAHLMEIIVASNVTPKRKIETAKEGKKCQLTKKSEVSKVVKRRREERIWEGRDRENKASTSKTHSTHQTSSTKSYVHENMKNLNKPLKIARKLQVEASTSNHSHSTGQISSKISLANVQTSEANFNKKADRRNDNVTNLNFYYKCKNCNKYFVHENDVKQHMVTNHPDQKHMFEKIRVEIQKPEEVPGGLDRPKVSSTKKNLTSMSEDMPNKNNKIYKKRDHKQSPTKPVSFRPEIKESLSLQNKPSSRWEPDIVSQNDAVHAANKKSTTTKRALKNNPTKIVNKVRFSHCHNSKRGAPRKVTRTEKIKLFKSSCGLHFTSYESIQNHVDECCGSCDTPKSNCKMCGYLFPANLLIAHQSAHHNNNNQINFDVVKLSLKSILHCTTCEKKFTYKKAFRNHVLQCTLKVHPRNFRTLNVLYKCSPCNIHYRTQQGLKQHVNRDHSDRGRTQKCDACNILLIGKAYSHHMEIQHKVMEYELKDLCIKYDKNDNSRTQTKNKTIGQSLHNTDKPVKNTSNGSVTHPAKSTDLNMEHANDRNQSLNEDKPPSNKTSTKDCISKPAKTIENANDNIISTANETNKESYETTDISPTILYKCHKCNVHFVTKTALKNHRTLKNCPDIKTSDEVSKCLKCTLVFYTESIIEHQATQHIGNNLKTSDDFVIICNETVENQSYDTPSKKNGNFTKESIRATKRLRNPDETEVPPSKRITFETDDDNYQKNDQTESVKSLAEAWIRKKYPEMSNVSWIDFDSYSNLLYRCHKCSLNFLNDVQIKMHLSKCDGKSDEWHQCPLCSYSFSKLSLKLHVYIHHAKLEMKRENLEIVSSKSRLNCPTTANDCISSKEQPLTAPQTVNNHDQSAANAFINGISKNNSDVTPELSNEVGIGELENYLYETKDIILSNNKSSRAKIAHAIESIDYPDEDNDIKPSVKINEANNIHNREEVNDNVITKQKKNLDSSSSLLKQDVLNATVHISSTLAVNPIDKPNDQITENEEDVPTDKLFEDIDSLVASLDRPKILKKKIALFKCHICPIHFMTKKTLESHILNRSHDENGKKCNYCNLIFHRKTIKKHMTNHHEKCNQSVKFFIKTAKTPVISEFFRNNQKGNIDLTQKQKSNMNKLAKNSIPTNVTEKNVKGASNTKPNCADNDLSDTKNPNPPKNNLKTKFGNLTNPNVPTLAENSIINNAEIIDLSNSQSVGPEGDSITDPVSLKSLTKDSQNNRKASVASNNHKDNLIEVTKRRTKSQDQRDGYKEITNYNSKSSKTATININTETNYKNESGITTVENNMNKKSELSVPSYLQLNNVDIVPIYPKASPDIETKTQQRSLNQHILPRRGAGLVEAEKTQENHLKQSYIHKSSNESQSPITTGTLSNQKSQRASYTRFVFEDSSFEVRATYENDDSSHIIHGESSKQQEEIKRKSSDDPRGSNDFFTDQNQQTAPTDSSSNNTPLTNPIDIIDITDETIDITEMQRENSTKNSTLQHGRLLNNASEQNLKVFGVQNRRTSIVTTSSGILNTPVAPPQPTTNSSTVQHSILPNNNNGFEQNINTAFELQNRRKSIAKNGSGIPNTPVASLQPKPNNNTEMPRKNITVQHGILSNNAYEQNLKAFSVQNRRKSIAITDSVIPNTPITTQQPTTNNNTEMPRNNSVQHNSFEQNNTAFGLHDRRKSIATNGSGIPNTTVAPPQPVQHGILPNNSFEQNMNTAFGTQYRRQTIPTISSGIPHNTPMAPSMTAHLNSSNFLNQSLLQNLAILQSQQYLQFLQPLFHNVQNQPKLDANQNKKRQAKTQKGPKVPDIFDTMTSCPICKCNDRVSSVRQHLKVRGGYFKCCFCARRSVKSVLETHIKECGSRLNLTI